MHKSIFLNNKFFNWLLFIGLSFIWGSSFILMKKGLVSLTAYQVASIRILSSGIILLPVALKNFTSIPKKKRLVLFLSGVQGSLLPAYLFCVAEEHIDSALAGTLNALTPVFVIIAGAVIFKTNASSNKIAGIAVSLAGSILLFFAQPGFHENSNIMFVLLVVIATMFYGINVNMVGKYLGGIPSLHIAALSLTLVSLPALAVLYFTGYFNTALTTPAILTATAYSALLGIMGTAMATVLFYILLKKAGTIFASMVTYGIPVVAVIWGVMYKEEVGWKQAVCLCIILMGVRIANRSSVKNYNGS